MTGRTTDEQIAALWDGGADPWERLTTALGLLEAERARGDRSEAKIRRLRERTLVAEFAAAEAAIEEDRLGGIRGLAKVLWNSRRMWQARSLEAEELRGDPTRALTTWEQLRLETTRANQCEAELGRLERQLAEARAWAAWLGAEVQYLRRVRPCRNKDDHQRVAVLESVVAEALAEHRRIHDEQHCCRIEDILAADNRIGGQE